MKKKREPTKKGPSIIHYRMTGELSIPSGAAGSYSDFCPCEHMSWLLQKIRYTIFILLEKESKTKLELHAARTS